MLEKFSASAIQTLNASREEALRLEFSQVDTDHLLLGLVHERNGLAARTLRKLGVEHRKIRLVVEQLSGRGYSLTRQEDLVFSPGALRVLARAASARPVLVDSGDIFLALLDECESPVEGVLAELALARGAIAELAAELAAARPEAGIAPEAPLLPAHFSQRLLTPAGQSVLGYAFAAARFHRHTLVGTEQLLVGLLYVQTGLASKVLAQHRVDPVEVEAVASRLIGTGSGTVPGRLSFSVICDAVFEKAWQEARRLKHVQVGTGHLLLGLTSVDVGGALYLMDHLGLDLAQLRLDVEQAFAAAGGDPEPESLGAGLAGTFDDEPALAEALEAD